MTEITVRQRNQVTIPADIALAAGIAPGAKFDLIWANGVITMRPIEHADSATSVLQYAGIGAGLWGSSPEEIEATIESNRAGWDR